MFTDDQKVFYYKGFVQHDRERGEQVPKNILNRQGDSHTPDTQSGDQRRHVITKIVDNEQERQRPDDKPHDK